MRPALNKLYQLRPKVSALSLSVASWVVNPMVKEIHQLYPNGSAWCVSYRDTTKPAEQTGKRSRSAASNTTHTHTHTHNTHTHTLHTHTHTTHTHTTHKHTHTHIRESTRCVSKLRNCIICVAGCLLHVYQVRPEMSTPNVTSCVPRLVGNCISCVPGCLLHAYLLCPESSTARVWDDSKGMAIKNVQQFEGSYTILLYVILYTNRSTSKAVSFCVPVIVFSLIQIATNRTTSKVAYISSEISF